MVSRFVEHYNHHRLHSAIGYVTTADKLHGRERAVWTERDRKLDEARELRRQRRTAQRTSAACPCELVIGACWL